MSKGKRIIGLDILRIMSMFGIVGLHVINRGGLIHNSEMHSIKYYIIFLLLILFYTSVDVFGILSGYLNVDKEKNRHSRIVELILIVIFYCLIIPSIYYILNPNKITSSYKELILNFIPILDDRYWYITSYIFLFLLIPYINKFCIILDKKTFKKFLILLFILLTIIPNLLLGHDIFKILSGYSPFWLIYCYMVGAYIKLYEIQLDIKKAFRLFIILFFATFITNSIIRYIGYLIFKIAIKESLFIDYVSPLIVTLSILLILLYKNINIKNSKFYKIINYLSTMSFAVYVIHCHRIIYDYYLCDLFVPLLKYNSVIVFLGIIMSIALIYIICCIIDEIRKLIFKFFNINKLIDFIGNKLDKLLN